MSVLRIMASGLLALVGLYVLVQPFDISPLRCLQNWPDLGVAVRNCATAEPVAGGFWAGLIVGAAALGLGVGSLRGR